MLKKYNMAHAMYYKPKKLNEFELLIVKYLRDIHLYELLL